MAGSHLENLSPELFSNILGFIDDVEGIHDIRTLNQLSQTSRALYHLTVPSLYHSFSYHGMQQETKTLQRFLETLNWRPDLAAHVEELDLREWANCPKLEEYVGFYGDKEDEEREREREEGEKELRVDTLMDDELVGKEGDEDDDEDETYEESDWSGGSEDSEDDIEVDENEMEVDEDEILREELKFLGPTHPFNHDGCLKGHCKNGIDESLKREARDLGFEQDTILHNYWKIWNPQSNKEDEDAGENELLAVLLSQCQNLRTMYMVMPEVNEWSWESNSLCQFLNNQSNLSTLGALQKLEALYICSPMHPGGKDHRQYELDFRRLFPFMRLPNLRSLYTLTAYVYWDHWPSPPLDYVPLRHSSNITTLVYDECTLNPHDVTQSLSIYKSLKSFRWTTSPSCFGMGDSFIGFQHNFGKALFPHKDTLEELYFDNRHPQVHMHTPEKEIGRNKIIFGSLREYPKLRKLAIDVTSLIGHQNWTSSELPLIDILPPKLEELTLFVKIRNKTQNNDDSNEAAKDMIFDNDFFYPAFISMLQSVRSKLPELREIRIELTRDATRSWNQQALGDEIEGDIVIVEAKFTEARLLCLEAGVAWVLAVAVECDEDEIRDVGNTTIPYFQEQIRGRNPGRDW